MERKNSAGDFEFEDCGTRGGQRYSLRGEYKKNAVANPGAQAPVKARVIREIRLQPSQSDYETFARTTALAMGKTVRRASAPKPNTRLLSLLNLGA